MTQRFFDDPAAIPGSLMIRKAIVRAYIEAGRDNLGWVVQHQAILGRLTLTTGMPIIPRASKDNRLRSLFGMTLSIRSIGSTRRPRGEVSENGMRKHCGSRCRY